MMKATAAAIYARISRDTTGEGLGIERQLEDCRKLAVDRGWTIAQEYIDNDISAYSGKRRPAYQQMLEDIESGQRDAVIAYNADRLTRRPIELEQFTGLCERAGVRLFATVTADIDIGNDDGMFMARILAAVAAKESGRKSERQRRKARQIAESGMPNGGSLRPFGYEKDRMTVVPSEAEILRQVAARYLAGDSLQSLVAWMQSEGILSVANKPWRTSTLRTTLVNPRIAGLRAHRGEVVGPAKWGAIITPAQHEQLVSKFTSRAVSDRRTPRKYLLSGLLRCGRCGNKLFSSLRRDGKIPTRRYVCSSSVDHGGCGKLTVVAEPVEEWITEAILARLDSPAMSDALEGRVAEDRRHAALMSELDADRAQSKELAQMWAAKVISSEEWIAAREPIEARIRAEERQLSALRGTQALDGWIGNGGALQADWARLNLTRQAAIVAAVLDYATIAPGQPGARSLDPTRIVPTWRL